MNVPVPPDAATETEPLLLPQVAFVEAGVAVIAGGWVIVTVVIEEQPPLVIVTVYVTAISEVVLCEVDVVIELTPLLQMYVYVPLPPVANAVAEPVFPVLHVTLANAETEAVIPDEFTVVVVVITLQSAFATVTVKVPAHSAVAVCEV